jgi:endonuclease YncB( thermonuclease family)
MRHAVDFHPFPSPVLGSSPGGLFYGDVVTMHRLVAAALSIFVLVTATPACAAACAFESQDEGRVTEVIDGRGFRLSDGREIRLAGIELIAADDNGSVLAALVKDKEVSLHGPDAPDRYGRQTAFAFLAGADVSVQAQLLAQGAALASPDIADKDCAAALLAAEAEARTAKKGTWAQTSVIKNAESAADILAGIGRFVLVEGRVLSVRQAGTMTYLNFGRDTGLCCDYFKAHDAGGRIFRPHAQVLGESADSCSRLGRSAPRAADRGGQGGTNRSAERELNPPNTGMIRSRRPRSARACSGFRKGSGPRGRVT